MDKQLIFNDAVVALFKQGVRAIEREGYCVLRNHLGHKCNIGHLIPDEAYDPRLEGLKVSDQLLLEAIDKKYKVPTDKTVDAYFLRELQHIHDSGPSVLYWACAFRSLAEEYNLDMPDVLKEALK